MRSQTELMCCQVGLISSRAGIQMMKTLMLMRVEMAATVSLSVRAASLTSMRT